MAAQVVGAVGITIGIATASLLARDLSGSEKLAGLAQTFQVLGTAVSAFLLARLMSRRGRRVGLVHGLPARAAGAVLAVTAGVLGSMPLLLVGAMLLGATTAANNGSRYAATDLAPAHHRARALSLVVWATTFGAVAGPNLTGASAWEADRPRHPRAHRAVRPRQRRDARGGASSRSCCVPTRCWSPGRRRARGTAPTGTSWGRAVQAVRERPVIGYAVTGAGRGARRDGRGHGDDPAAHGARWGGAARSSAS